MGDAVALVGHRVHRIQLHVAGILGQGASQELQREEGEDQRIRTPGAGGGRGIQILHQRLGVRLGVGAPAEMDEVVPGQGLRDGDVEGGIGRLGAHQTLGQEGPKRLGGQGRGSPLPHREANRHHDEVPTLRVGILHVDAKPGEVFALREGTGPGPHRHEQPVGGLSFQGGRVHRQPPGVGVHWLDAPGQSRREDEERLPRPGEFDEGDGVGPPALDVSGSRTAEGGREEQGGEEGVEPSRHGGRLLWRGRDASAARVRREG